LGRESGLELRQRVLDVMAGAEHDRDINAAQNILAAGRGRIAGKIPGLKGREDVKLGLW